MNGFRRRTIWAVVSAAAAASMLIPSTAHAQQAEGSTDLDLFVLSPKAIAIAEKVQCVVCDGQSIVSSNATIAKQMRVAVQQRVDAGWTEREILNYFEESYGTFVLREPPVRGIATGLWLAPPMIALAGALAAVGVMRRWRRADRVMSPLTDVEDEQAVAQHLASLERDQRGTG